MSTTEYLAHRPEPPESPALVVKHWESADLAELNVDSPFVAPIWINHAGEMQ